MKTLRTMLFMPGNNPGMLVSADNLEADAIIYDLEDAVSTSQKDAARDLVANALRTLSYKNSVVTVRINPTDSPYWKDDIRAIIPAGPDGLVIPKSNKDTAKEVFDFIDEFTKENNIENNLKYYMLVESARGILELEDIVKQSDRIEGLLLGAEDYSVDMQVKRTEGSEEIAFARYRIVTVAKAYGLNAIDTPYTDIDNMEGLKKDTKFVKTIGFNGRLIVGPRQVFAVNEMFSPTQAEIEDAKVIVSQAEEAERKGLGVFSFRGKMVDKPIITRSENLLKSAKEWGLI
ncbi:MAG: CoA ester lyase [Peptoniphilus duerdenii]|uniref:HpcH/HpaI aldolase/citrate lyase family protein n=1 Tax=Peptoniphilus duerdenii TaxID=507750 RepID=UPI00254EEA41|nr:CoA ester lyase [Peptoniphilus duerdenii]MDK8276768.1 CoA ester lyase [Peptoniphilus duerdenii]